jgi:hypothetical protein
MSKASLKLKLLVDFAICPKCSKGPKDNSTIERFLREHASHTNSLQQPRIIGYLDSPGFLRKKLVSIRFVEEPKKVVEEVNCRWKKCKNYQKGYKLFCRDKCKKQYRKYKRRKK